jgi:type III secretion protein HrpB1
MADLLPVRKDLIQALISILSRGIQDGNLDDAEEVLATLNILSPGHIGINEFLPYIAIKRGRVREALQMYAASPSDDSKWHAMTALCLRLLGDPTWHGHATQAIEKDDSTSGYAHILARILLGREQEEPVEDVKLKQDTSPIVDYANYRAV